MSVEYESRKVIDRLKKSAEETTNEKYANLTEAHQALKNGHRKLVPLYVSLSKDRSTEEFFPQLNEAYNYVSVTTDILKQEKIVDITKNGTTEITPDADGALISKVTVNVDVPSSGGGNDNSLKNFIERTTSKPTLPSDLESIGAYAFYNYVSLSIGSLPNSITDIDVYAFFGCTSLSLSSLPNGIKTIGNNAFQNCSSLALVSLPESLTSTGNNSFANCRNIKIEEIPNGVTKIGNAAFSNCTGIYSLTFKGTIDTISNNALNGCTNLKDIYVPWAEGEVANAPWGATNATIHYNSEV